MTPPPHDRTTTGSTVLVALLGYYALSSPTLLPALVGEWIGRAALSEREAGFVAAATLICQTMGLLTGMVAIRRQSLAKVAGAGLILAALGDALSIFAVAYAPILACRGVTGIGTGMILAAVVNWLGRQAVPSRGFAIFVTFQFLMPVPIILLLPRATALLGHGAIYLIMLAVALVAVPALRPLARLRHPPREALADTVDAAGARGDLRFMVPAVCASTLFSACVVGSWAFLLPYATRSGIDAETGMTAVALSSACGVPGSLLVAWLGLRLGRVVPLSAALASLCALFAWFSLAAPGPATFYVQVALLNLVWAFTAPLIQGTQAALDRRGMLPVWGSIAGSVGSGLGPGILGQMISGGTFAAAFGIIAVGIVLCAALILPPAWSVGAGGHRRPGAPA